MRSDRFNPQIPKNPATRAVWVRPLASLFVWGVGFVLLFKFWGAIKLVGLGLLISAAVAAALHPLMTKIRMPRTISALIVGILFFATAGGIIFLLSYLLIEPIKAQAQQLEQTRVSINELLSSIGRNFGLTQAITVESLAGQLVDFITGEAIADIVARAADVATVLALVFAFLFIGSVYLLASPPNHYSRPLLKLLPSWRRPMMVGFIHELQPQLRWWLLGTLISMSTIGIASYIGYTIVGIEFVLPLAMFAALSEAIPTIGPAATLVVSLMIAATMGLAQVVGVVIVYIIVQGLESYLLLPLVMKRTVHIPPVVTLFTLILWGKILGLAGLLLAIPLDLVIWGLLRHFVMDSHELAQPKSSAP